MLLRIRNVRGSPREDRDHAVEESSVEFILLQDDIAWFSFLVLDMVFCSTKPRERDIGQRRIMVGGCLDTPDQ